MWGLRYNLPGGGPAPLIRNPIICIARIMVIWSMYNLVMGMVGVVLEAMLGTDCEHWTSTFNYMAIFVSIACVLFWLNLSCLRIASDSTWVCLLLILTFLLLLEAGATMYGIWNWFASNEVFGTDQCFAKSGSECTEWKKVKVMDDCPSPGDAVYDEEKRCEEKNNPCCKLTEACWYANTQLWYATGLSAPSMFVHSCVVFLVMYFLLVPKLRRLILENANME